MWEVKHQIADLLLQIEAELRRLQVWGRRPPELGRLCSTTPFCADTLSLTEWLQWIFVPRMKVILEQGLPLPQRCDIHPYAEEVCLGVEYDSSLLLHLLREFDQQINSSGLVEEEDLESH